VLTRHKYPVTLSFLHTHLGGAAVPSASSSAAQNAGFLKLQTSVSERELFCHFPVTVAHIQLHISDLVLALLASADTGAEENLLPFTVLLQECNIVMFFSPESLGYLTTASKLSWLFMC